MHKMTNAVMEIIKAMASNAYNGTKDRRILKKSTGVHQVEVNSSSIDIRQKLDVLAKHMKTLMKENSNDDTYSPPIVCN